MNSLETLLKSKASELKDLAKSHRVPGWWKLNKEKLIEALIPLTQDMVEESLPDVVQSSEEFIKKGGMVTVGKPQKPWKQVPPTSKSALKSIHKIQKHLETGKKKAKGKVTLKRNNPDIITLQQICAEMGVGAYKVRKALRATDKIKKPGSQWHWESSDQPSIKAVKLFIKSLEK